jgi:hypothetical protein
MWPTVGEMCLHIAHACSLGKLVTTETLETAVVTVTFKYRI